MFLRKKHQLVTASSSYKRKGREEEEANNKEKEENTNNKRKGRKVRGMKQKPHLVTRSIPPAKRDTATLGSSLCLKTKSIIDKQNDKRMMSISKILDIISYLSLRYF